MDRNNIKLKGRNIHYINYGIYEETPRNKEKFNNDEELTCIFCGKADSSVTFKKEAHIIPAGLGNRIFFNKTECDDCNHTIGQHEDHLVKLLSFERVLAGIQKRSGYGKLSLGKQQTSKASREGKEAALSILTTPESEDVIFEELGDRKAKIKFKNEIKFNPGSVVKSLIHMAVSILPYEKQKEYSQYKSWVVNEKRLESTFRINMIPLKGNGSNRAHLEVIESETENFCSVNFIYGGKLIQTYLFKDLNKDHPSKPSIIDVDGVFFHLLPDEHRVNNLQFYGDDNIFELQNTELVIEYQDIEKNGN